MSIFEVTPEDVERLSDVDLRILVAYVAEREVSRAGYSPVSVTYGGHQNAGDGGIDVRIDLADEAAIDGYIPRPKTGLQVKAEDMAKADILKEMKPGGVLRPSIVELGEAGGAYIIVSSKGTVSDKQLSARRNAMGDAIAGVAGIDELHLDFYDRRRLATWVNQNPGLIPWVRSRTGKPLAGWQPFSDWSSSPGKIDDEYLLDAGIRLVGVRLKDTDGLSAVEGIGRVREALREANGVVRLVGLSGVGKTRFVQALFDERIGIDALNSTVAVYTDVADTPDPLPLDLVTRLKDLGQSCVLIIDNCGLELHRKLSARIRAGGSPISLITVEYDISDDEPEGTDVFKLEPASPEVVDRILKIKHPQLSDPERRTISAFSEGNARIALALADTARHGGSLANLKDSDLFKRLFRQRNADDPALLRAAKVCSLVYSFDGETLDDSESELVLLASLAGQPVEDFHAHVAELNRRQLIQKRGKWRAFLPHALAHRLAREALEDLPFASVETHLIASGKERLIKSFSRRLGALHDSPQAQKIVGQWLKPGGWISDTENLTPLGLVVFSNIAPVNPDAVLSAISECLGRLQQTDQNSILLDKLASLLRSLAYDPAHFTEATRLIAALAGKGDPSNRTNDAINIFASLFYLYLSGTHAPVEQRAELLLSIGRVNSDENQNLALRGLDSMLESGHFSSMHSFEFGTRKRDYGWHPKTSAEVQHWYATALGLCEDLAALPQLRERARAQFGRDLRSLAHNLLFTDNLIAIAKRFDLDGGWPEGWAAAKGAANALRRDAQHDAAEKFRDLADHLQPTSLAARIASYVLPERWSALDVTDAEFDDDKRYEKAEAAAEAMCKTIGGELAADAAALTANLPDLLKCKSPRVWSVFSALAQNTPDWPNTWKNIVDGYSALPTTGRQNGALCGFVAGLATRDMQARETLLDEALANIALHDTLVRMHTSPSVSPQGAERLAKAAQLPTVPTWSFANLQFGGCCDDLTGAEFGALTAAISERDDGVSTAIEVMGMRVYSRRNDQKHLDADDKRTARKLLLNFPVVRGQSSEADAIARIARPCLSAPGDEVVAEQLCERLLDGLKTYAIYAWDYGDLVAALAQEFPRVVLDVLVGKGQDAMDGRSNMFQHFRENKPCPLDNIPDETLIEWAKSGPEERYVQLAETVRLWIGPDGSLNDEEAGALVWTSAAFKLIDAAPDPLPVVNAMFGRFSPSGWSGSLADILASRLPLLRQLEASDNPRVAAWATNARTPFQANVEAQRNREALDSRQRDERFEW